MQPEHPLPRGARTTALVERFWTLMASNDFHSVAEVCAAHLVVEWPQSRERFVGVARFAQMNHDYIAHGRWQFQVRRLVAGDLHAVTEVAITDSVQHATAVSFFSIEGDRITRIVEYWPEPFAAPANRAHLAETMDPEPS